MGHRWVRWMCLKMGYTGDVMGIFHLIHIMSENGGHHNLWPININKQWFRVHCF